MDTNNIHWLAGLLEGEGYFGRIHSVVVRLRMTDNDVVAQAAEVMNTKVGGPYKPGAKGKKAIYVAALYGSQAAQWMMTLYSLMGKRNRDRIRRELAFWRKQSNKWSNLRLVE